MDDLVQPSTLHSCARGLEAAANMILAGQTPSADAIKNVARHCDEAAARIQALETSLAEAEGRVIADVVAWLRKGADYKDGHIGPGTIAHYEKLATALETGEWKK